MGRFLRELDPVGFELGFSDADWMWSGSIWAFEVIACSCFRFTVFDPESEDIDLAIDSLLKRLLNTSLISIPASSFHSFVRRSFIHSFIHSVLARPLFH